MSESLLSFLVAQAKQEAQLLRRFMLSLKENKQKNAQGFEEGQSSQNWGLREAWSRAHEKKVEVFGVGTMSLS